MKQLSTRQLLIYDFIIKNTNVSNREIKGYLRAKNEPVSRVTIVRELDWLIKNNFITKEGAGRSIKYRTKQSSPLLRYFEPDSYFFKDVDDRNIIEHFNFEVFDQFTTLFSASELTHLTQLTNHYQKNLNKLSKEQHQKEIERLTIELSWKSSQIEGNTYTLLDTEALIKEKRLAPNTTQEEASMILNHKTAIDYIFANTTHYKVLSVRKIEDIHRLLVANLNVNNGLREGLIRITGTKYIPLSTIYQIQESLKRMVKIVNHYDDVFHKALITIVLISYIQPFMDGNKRTGRLIGNAILHSGQACPLSYRSIDPVDYKKAMLLFYEQNSILNFKELFISQYEFSITNYFSPETITRYGFL